MGWFYSLPHLNIIASSKGSLILENQPIDNTIFVKKLDKLMNCICFGALLSYNFKTTKKSPITNLPPKYQRHHRHESLNLGEWRWAAGRWAQHSDHGAARRILLWPSSLCPLSPLLPTQNISLYESNRISMCV